jgi:type II secretory pathway component PulC
MCLHNYIYKKVVRVHMSSGLYTNIAIIYMKIVTVIWTLTSTNVHISISSTFKNTYPSQGSAASTLD